MVAGKLKFGMLLEIVMKPIRKKIQLESKIENWYLGSTWNT
jgi:hypothetical protein